MRENMGLYRGRRLIDNKGVFGGLITAYGRAWIKDADDHVTNPRKMDLLCETADWRCVEVDPATVGEATGLPDKNGKMIFEGDICKVKNPNGEAEADWEIKWAPRSSCFPYAPEDGFDDYDITTLGWAMDMGFEFEVIGTIHDHGKGAGDEN